MFSLGLLESSDVHLATLRELDDVILTAEEIKLVMLTHLKLFPTLMKNAILPNIFNLCLGKPGGSDRPPD